MDPSYTQKLRNSPQECPETPSDAILILDDGSTYPVNKVILASQSDFFEALFTFEDKTEYKISNVTQEVLKIIIDDFYGISTVFDKHPERFIIYQEIDMMQEVIAQAHYFQAPFILGKTIKCVVELFEFNIGELYSTWIFDLLSETLIFARNFLIRELQIEIERLFIQLCKCGNNGSCYYCHKAKDPNFKRFNSK